MLSERIKSLLALGDIVGPAAGYHPIVPATDGARDEGLAAMTNDRFLTLGDVADVLNISASQTYALVRSGDLQGLQIGGRNQWRVERTKLEEYIERAYQRAEAPESLSELDS